MNTVAPIIRRTTVRQQFTIYIDNQLSVIPLILWIRTGAKSRCQFHSLAIDQLYNTCYSGTGLYSEEKL